MCNEISYYSLQVCRHLGTPEFTISAIDTCRCTSRRRPRTNKIQARTRTTVTRMHHACWRSHTRIGLELTTKFIECMSNAIILQETFAISQRPNYPAAVYICAINFDTSRPRRDNPSLLHSHTPFCRHTSPPSITAWFILHQGYHFAFTLWHFHVF